MNQKSTTRRALSRRPQFEPLEPRRVLAAATVGNNVDIVNGDTSSIAALLATPGADGVSLREAVLAANVTPGADVITFAAHLSGQTIQLSGTHIAVTDELTIDAASLGAKVTIDARQLSRVFNVDDPNLTNENFPVTLSGLTLTGGRTTAVGDPGRGGAVRSVTAGLLTITQSAVTGNLTTADGAHGGGVAATGPVTLLETLIHDNRTTGVGGDGGGLFTQSTLTLTRSTVSANVTQKDGARGGGLFALGDLTLNHSTITGNHGNGGGARGGGVYGFSQVTLNNTAVAYNTTGGMYGGGGGIFSRGHLTLTQSTLAGNNVTGIASLGGAVMAHGAVTLIHSTVTDNHVSHASSHGGGIAQVDQVSNSPIVLVNSILSGNTAPFFEDDLMADPGSPITANFSLLGTAVLPTAGADNVVADNPGLAQLGYSGGPIVPRVPLPSSPALDRGDPSVAPDPMQFDQRGAPLLRVRDGDGDSVARIDIGAAERQPASADFDSSSRVNGFDFLHWQRGFTTAFAATRLDGDSDEDGDVDAADFAVWKLQFGDLPPAAEASGVSPTDSVFARSGADDVALALPSATSLPPQLPLEHSLLGMQTPGDREAPSLHRRKLRSARR